MRTPRSASRRETTRSHRPHHRSSALPPPSTDHPGTTPTPQPGPPKTDNAASACAESVYQTCRDTVDTTPRNPHPDSTSHIAACAPAASIGDRAFPLHRKDAVAPSYTTQSHLAPRTPHRHSPPAATVLSAWLARACEAGRAYD